MGSDCISSDHCLSFYFVWKIPSKRVGPMSVDCLSVCCKKNIYYD